MPPEIDNSNSKRDPVPFADFYSFNQGSLSFAEKSVSNIGKQNSLELTDPYGFHQGMTELSNVIANLGDHGARADRVKNEVVPNSSEQTIEKGSNLPTVLDQLKPPNEQVPPKPYDYNQGDKNPVNVPKPGQIPLDPALPQTDLKPNPRLNLPSEIKPNQDSNDRVSDASINRPGTGKSPIVEAYERKQGARHAGTGNLPAIDAIPGPNDVYPPTPGPKPLPDVAPWNKPELQPNPNKPEDSRPNPSDQISKIEPKYETDNIARAVKMAQDTGLPLAVHIGAKWCGACVGMEQNVWPSVEGTANRKGSMQGKVVVLHLDVDQASNLDGQSAEFAQKIMQNRGGSVPLLRVFNVDQSGNFTKTNQHVGAFSSRSGLENFLIQGGAKK